MNKPAYPKREALTSRDDPVYLRWLSENEERIMAYQKAKAPFPPFCHKLHENGIVVVPGEALFDPLRLDQTSSTILKWLETDKMRSDIEKQKTMEWKDFVVLVRFGENALLRHASVSLALDPHLLATVAGYLGLWPRLADVSVHVNYPTPGPPSVTQLWHRDPGDIRLCKVFVYLCDVGLDNGPFCYIPGSHPFGRLSHIIPEKWETGLTDRERELRVTDAEMEKAIPSTGWRVCVGKKHTTILADTIGWHRGLKPKAGMRVLLCLTYGSGVGASNFRFTEIPAHWELSPSQEWAMR